MGNLLVELAWAALWLAAWLAPVAFFLAVGVASHGVGDPRARSIIQRLALAVFVLAVLFAYAWFG